MILVVYGTTGELIKLAPVLTRIRERGGAYLSATTGQQVTQIPPLLDLLGLPQPDVWLGRGRHGRDLRTNADIPFWAAGVAARFAARRGGLRRGLGRMPLVVVHGDTMTTVLGTLMGKALRAPVAHVEAGVRTWDLRHPFPEELNRRVVTRLADIHYAPGPDAAANVRRGAVVDTGMNTLRDSLELCPPREPPPGLDPPYGVVSLHRYELLGNRELLASTLRTLAAHAARTPLVFVDHPVTAAALERFGLGGIFGERFRRIPRLDFFSFVGLLRATEFLVTDSGGGQVECYVLDRPCLVHRKRVEQRAGLGETTVVSGFSTAALEDFLHDPSRFRRRGPLPDVSPSDVIVDDLAARGYLAPAGSASKVRP